MWKRRVHEVYIRKEKNMLKLLLADRDPGTEKLIVQGFLLPDGFLCIMRIYVPRLLLFPYRRE